MCYFLVKRKWFLSGCLLIKMFMNSHKTDPNSCDFFFFWLSFSDIKFI